ncbi:MAG TPA: DUF6232 family protein [Micromonospora sp.]
MTTYYDDGSIRVTSTVVEVHGGSYPLTQLRRVWYVRGPRSWRVVSRRGALVAAMVTPLAGAVAGVVLAVRADAPLTVTVTGVAAACLLGLATGPLADLLLDRVDRSYDRGSRQLEIWVDLRGRPVLVLRTRDALRFGRIYRALQRAVERIEATRGHTH